jgi:hypothetical protein
LEAWERQRTQEETELLPGLLGEETERERRARERHDRHLQAMADQAVADAVQLLTAANQQAILDRQTAEAERNRIEAERVTAARDAATQRERQNRESDIKALVNRINKCNGEDDTKTLRWLRDINAVHAEQPRLSVDVAIRTSQAVLADRIQNYITENPPRNAVTWPPMLLYVKAQILGPNHETILAMSVDNAKQKAHESVDEYSRRFLMLAEDAYPGVWDGARNRQLVAAFARGLEETKLKELLVINQVAGTLRETVDRARTIVQSRTAYGIEKEDVSAVQTVVSSAKPDKSPLSDLEKQIAVLSTKVGEIAKGVTKPPPGGLTCHNCGKRGHFQRECRAPKKTKGPQRRDTRTCYNCGQQGHIARDCHARKKSTAPTYPVTDQPAYPGQQQQPRAEAAVFQPGNYEPVPIAVSYNQQPTNQGNPFMGAAQ